MGRAGNPRRKSGASPPASGKRSHFGSKRSDEMARNTKSRTSRIWERAASCGGHAQRASRKLALASLADIYTYHTNSRRQGKPRFFSQTGETGGLGRVCLYANVSARARAVRPNTSGGAVGTDCRTVLGRHHVRRACLRVRPVRPAAGVGRRAFMPYSDWSCSSLSSFPLRDVATPCFAAAQPPCLALPSLATLNVPKQIPASSLPAAPGTYHTFPSQPLFMLTGQSSARTASPSRWFAATRAGDASARVRCVAP